MTEDSLKKRYGSKLTGNLVKFALSFVTLGMLPRAFGPEVYGNLGFLTIFFTRATKFLKFGIPTAYYTKLSKRPDEKKLIGFYIYYVIFVILILFTGLLGIFKLGLWEIIWPDQKGVFIFAAALLAILIFMTDSFRSTTDALGYTFKYEIKLILQSIMGAGLTVVLFMTNKLTLSSYFLMQYLLLLYVIITGWRILRTNKIFSSKQMTLTKQEVVGYIKEFFRYSHPLFVNGFVVFFAVILDRWLLQIFHGSEEQGYYTVALKIASIVFLFTSSIIPLIIREMSLKFKNKNKKEIKIIFKRYVPLFYFIAAYFSVFISLNSESVSIIVGGLQYENATIIIAVLAFLPLHNTYSHLVTSVLLVNERTNVLRDVSFYTLLPGMILSLFILGPVEYNGLGLGAFGLAIKVVGIQFVAVNIYLFVVTKYLNMSFYKNFFYQLIIPAILFILVKLSQYFVSLFLVDKILIGTFISGFLYTIIVLTSVITCPKLIGWNSIEMKIFIYGFFRIEKT